MNQRNVTGALLTACVLALATSVRAGDDPHASDDVDEEKPATDEAVERARELFIEATELVRKAQWSEALSAFERSAAIRPHAVTSYNMGACLRATGRFVLARRRFDEALRQHEASGGTQLSDVLQNELAAFLKEIEDVVVRLDVTLAPTSAVVAIDGRRLEAHGDQREGRPVYVLGQLPADGGAVLPKGRFFVELDPGVHVVTLSRKGYRKAVVQRSYAPGSQETLALQLDKLPAKLNIAANLADAVVTVDGRDVGMAPVTVSRPGGSYTVVVARDGYITYETTARVDPGEQWRVKANLVEETPPLYERWWFWGAIGAGITGVAVGTFFAARPDPERPPADGGDLQWVVEVPAIAW